MHLAQRYRTIVAGRLSGVAPAEGTFTLNVTHTLKGSFAPETVTVKTAGNVDADAVIFLPKDQVIVAFVGKTRKRHERDILFYTGSGVWQKAVAAEGDWSEWEWTETMEGQEDNSLFGTYNGIEERFLEMMEDARDGRAFFPAVPFVSFTNTVEVAKLAAPIHGVALYDFDGDGDLDIYACSDKGNRAYACVAPMTFKDETRSLGLEGLAGRSCSFADINGDGKPDLLAGATILAGGKQGFVATRVLPPAAGDRLLSSAFVEINGDGYPDVVVSRSGGGLSVYLNPANRGDDQARFSDATSSLGLSEPACGRGGTGYFAPGDWNGDGRTDLFYASGTGLLLRQGDKGAFRPLPHQLPLDFMVDSVPGLTGAGCLAPVWHTDRLSLVLPSDSVHHLVVSDPAGLRDVVFAGNESTESSKQQVSALAEDLNVDGYVDYYTGSRNPDEPNFFHTNRGYGSFLRPEKYRRGCFPSEGHGSGAIGLAVGDVNADGANDLLLGGANGVLTLMINGTLKYRYAKENPTYHERVLSETRILKVVLPQCVGLLGARVMLTDDRGRIAALREIGSNVNVGSCSDTTLNLAVRNAAAYVLRVKYSDGHAKTWPVDLRASDSRLIVLTAERD